MTSAKKDVILSGLRAGSPAVISIQFYSVIPALITAIASSGYSGFFNTIMIADQYAPYSLKQAGRKRMKTIE